MNTRLTGDLGAVAAGAAHRNDASPLHQCAQGRGQGGGTHIVHHHVHAALARHRAHCARPARLPGDVQAPIRPFRQRPGRLGGGAGQHQHAGAAEPGNLLGGDIDAAPGADHQHLLARLQPAHLDQAVPGRQIGQRRRRGHLQIEAGGDFDQIARRHRGVLRHDPGRTFAQDAERITEIVASLVAAHAPAAPDAVVGRNPLAGPPSVNPGPHLDDLPAEIASGHMRQGQADAGPANPNPVVQPIQGAVADPDHNLVGAADGFGHTLGIEIGVGVEAELPNLDGFHGCGGGEFNGPDWRKLSASLLQHSLRARSARWQMHHCTHPLR